MVAASESTLFFSSGLSPDNTRVRFLIFAPRLDRPPLSTTEMMDKRELTRLLLYALDDNLEKDTVGSINTRGTDELCEGKY